MLTISLIGATVTLLDPAATERSNGSAFGSVKASGLGSVLSVVVAVLGASTTSVGASQLGLSSRFLHGAQ